MQYSLSSTNGTNGSWVDATESNTTVTFTGNAKVYVRSKAQPSTFRLVATIAAPVSAPATTFSFDGQSAGKLMGSTTAHQFSVDGGTTWIDVTQADQALTQQQLAAITEMNDIKVRAKATVTALASAVRTHDVLAGSTTIIGNFYLDTKTGQTSNSHTGYEYSIDGGTTWTVFTNQHQTLTPVVLADLSDIKDFQFRYRARELTLAGVTNTKDLTASTAITLGTATYNRSTGILDSGDGNLAAGVYLWRAETAADTWSEWELVTLTGSSPFTVVATKPGTNLKVELKAISGTKTAPSSSVQITSAD